MPERKDYYKILQIDPSAEPEVIEAAYRRLARKYHPDISKDPTANERMKELNLAYEILSDPEKRKQYDSEWLKKKPEPARARDGAIPRTKRTTHASPPPVTHKRVIPTWLKWPIGIIALALVIVIARNVWPSSETGSTVPTKNLPSTSQETTSSTPTSGPILCKGHYYSYAPGIENTHFKENLEKWLGETYPDLVEDRDMFGDPTFTIEDYASVGKYIWTIGSAFMGYGYVFHSADDGQTWSTQWHDDFSRIGGSYPFVIYFWNTEQGWVGSKRGLYYTSDGGQNWEFRRVGGEGSYIAEYYFYDDGSISAVRAYGDNVVSFDGGKTWE